MVLGLSKACGETEAMRQFEVLERTHRVVALELFSCLIDQLRRQNRIRESVAHSRAGPNISALERLFGVVRRTINHNLQELIRRG